MTWLDRTIAIGAAALCLLGAALPAGAAEFPAAFRGLWLTGKSCDDVAGYAVFGNDFGLSGTLTRGDNGKFGVFGFSPDVILDAKPDKLTVRFPFTGGDDVDESMVREIKDGRLYVYLSHKPDKRTEAFRCPAPGSPDPNRRTMLRLLRRLDIFVRAYSGIAEKCLPASDNLQPCAAQLLAFLDINGDGKIAPAEVTTFLRRYLPALALFGDKDAKFRAGYRTVFIEPDDLTAIEAAAAVFGPFVTNMVFANFDYDGNGFMSVDEVALTLKQEGLPGGASDAIRMLSDTREQAEDALGALGGMAGGMLGSPKGPPGHHGDTP